MDVIVNVVNQKIRIVSNLRSFVSDSEEFVHFVFSLDSAWDNLVKFAQFVQNDTPYNQLLDDENSTYLPSDIEAGTCTMTLYGSYGGVVATTNTIELTIDENKLISDVNSTGITLPLYQQLINAFKAMVGSPLSAATVAEMTDESKVYVYIGSESGYTNGNWYYHDGTGWVSGGVYNSVAVTTDTSFLLSGVPADSKTVGDALGEVQTLTVSGNTLIIS